MALYGTHKPGVDWRMDSTTIQVMADPDTSPQMFAAAARKANGGHPVKKRSAHILKSAKRKTVVFTRTQQTA